MRIGFIGLGKMGSAMVPRLLDHRVEVVAYNRTSTKTHLAVRAGAIAASSVVDLVAKLPQQKIVWLMLPAGAPTRGMLEQLLKVLKRGDIVVNGANDFFENAQKFEKQFAKRGIALIDCGVSGGVHGRKNGFTLMCGGSRAAYQRILPLIRALAAPGAFGYVGPSGAGHFVKSVHNVIEYVYLQGLAEGVELLHGYPAKLDVAAVLKIWEPASVVRSWLLELSNVALRRADFAKLKPEIAGVTTDELLATVRSQKANAPAFLAAVKTRNDRSKKMANGKRLIAAVRREFGGHSVTKH